MTLDLGFLKGRGKFLRNLVNSFLFVHGAHLNAFERRWLQSTDDSPGAQILKERLRTKQRKFRKLIRKGKRAAARYYKWPSRDMDGILFLARQWEKAGKPLCR